MITVMLVFWAMFEFFKMVGAENYVKWGIRLKKLDLEKEVWREKQKTGYNVPEPKPLQEDVILTFLLLPVAFGYLFTVLWVAIFGANIYAQGAAVASLLLGLLQTLVMRKVKLESFKLRTTYVIVDSFIGVVMCCAMAYFYQRPL